MVRIKVGLGLTQFLVRKWSKLKVSKIFQNSKFGPLQKFSISDFWLFWKFNFLFFWWFFELFFIIQIRHVNESFFIKKHYYFTFCWSGTKRYESCWNPDLVQVGLGPDLVLDQKSIFRKLTFHFFHFLNFASFNFWCNIFYFFSVRHSLWISNFLCF
jgi:hypothetical protein